MKVESQENWKTVHHSHREGREEVKKRELRVQWWAGLGGEVNLHTDKGTGLPTRRSSGMERLKVHSWLLTTASVTEKL